VTAVTKVVFAGGEANECYYRSEHMICASYTPKIIELSRKLAKSHRHEI